ncbi:hypothetical protein BAU15_02655 [Enterococcus sp. JM4C]|uniref:hypothetical protein n=1 Tax=Candidatus Enterococcus huntleyi TaxID=1857217 RepID=UPI00137A42F8|nr:hypothetical protein [Enterococcus sp. JM4C]KAF1299562.1 hypothetical protein BAU15_02655 [Enterococcus sp. JM4C]
MIIDCKEIEFFSKKKEVPNKYYQILEREIVQGIKSLSFVTTVKVRRAKKTNSIYFETRTKKLTEPLTVSIRTHAPIEKRPDYLYILLPNYEAMSKVIDDIQWKFTALYNQSVGLAEKEVYICPEERRNLQADLADKKRQKKKKNNLPNKAKGTRTDFKRAQKESYDEFLESFKTTSDS